MVKYLTYEYRIYPNKKQRELISLTFKMCRYMYNTLLKLKADIFNQFISYSNECYKNQENVDEKTFSKSHKLPRMSILKKVDERYSKIDSLSLCAELNHLNRAFENFYSGRSKFPKYKRRKDKNTYTTSCVNNNIRIEGRKKIRLPKLGNVKAVVHRNIPENSKIKRAVIKEDKMGKYYVSLILEVMENKEIDINEPIYIKENVIGLDFKVGEIFVTSEGTKPDFERPYKKSLEKLRIYEKNLRNKVRFSKGYWRCINEIRKLHKKVVNKRKDFLHKISKRIAEKYEYVGIEDISLKEIAKRLSTGINVYETGYKTFIERIKYKIKGEIIVVDKWYPSSKLCSNCGKKKRKLKLDMRVYRCGKCGLKIDRDINAAINIKKETIRMLEVMLK